MGTSGNYFLVSVWGIKKLYMERHQVYYYFEKLKNIAMYVGPLLLYSKGQSTYSIICEPTPLKDELKGEWRLATWQKDFSIKS